MDILEETINLLESEDDIIISESSRTQRDQALMLYKELGPNVSPKDFVEAGICDSFRTAITLKNMCAAELNKDYKPRSQRVDKLTLVYEFIKQKNAETSPSEIARKFSLPSSTADEYFYQLRRKYWEEKDVSDFISF